MSDLIDRRDALLREHLYYFVRKVYNTLHPGKECIPAWHVEAICHQLERVARGETKRLLITVPPRHLKSISTSVGFVAWLLGRDPTLKVLVTSYGDSLVADHSESFRKVISSGWYQDVFPRFRIDPKRNTRLEVKTTLGGRRHAVSIGGAITGFGADLLIIDDAMKAADASSPLERKRVQDYYDQTLLSRLDDKQNGRIINIQQRLHEDDLNGYLLDKGNFELLNLPAIAETKETIPLSINRHHVRRKGEALFPELEPLDALEDLRAEMGAFAFSSQYQQNPIPPDGNRLRWEWFGEYDEQPDRATLQMVVQSWDTASTGDPSSDFSACTVWGYLDGNWLLLEVVRERLEYPDLKRRAIGLAKNWLADKVLIEHAATGIPLAGELIELGEFPVLRIKPRLDKEIRFSAQGAKLETGTYLLPKAAPWLAAFKHELLGFPNAKYDDQVDSVSQFLTWAGSRRGAGWQHMKLTGKRRRRPSRRSRDSMRA